jgi:hypothetical protein
VSAAAKPVQHQSVSDYIDARRAGDGDRCRAILLAVTERFATRTTDGTEMAALARANQEVPLADTTDRT